MYQRFLALAVLPVGLFAQAITELIPLEYHPSPQQASSRAVTREPSSFAQRISPPLAHSLGRVRQAETDAVTRDPRLPMIGIERAIEQAVRPRGEWVTLNDGSTVWRVAIQSDGAAGVRVEFSNFAVGAGEVWLYSGDQSQVFGPYTGAGIDGSGEFWSHMIFADTAVVEYRPASSGPAAPRGRMNETPFTIGKVFHLLVSEQPLAAGTCELDVSCYSDWNAVSTGVGLYYFQKAGVGYACSGALVNNTNKDLKPYFLTASHCVSDATTAKTVDVFWKYQTATCNAKPPALSSVPQTLGATYLSSAAIGSGDYSLMLLSPLPNIGLTFYGWNGSATALPLAAAATGIHHPQADYKRIAFGVRTADVTAQVGTDLAPSSMYYQIQETSGRIEPGSSGSPLFTADKMIVGTLTYGPGGDACSISPFYAGYARFSVALPALASYLSPTASGGTPPPAAATVTANPTSVKLAWTVGTAAPAVQNIQLTTASTATITLTVAASQSWMQLSKTSLTLSQSLPATLSVTVNTQTFTNTTANVGSITLTGTGISKSIPFEVDVTAAATAVKGGPVTVIPLVIDGGGVATTFTLVNPYTTATVASISFASGTGAALSIPVASAAATSWQNVTIPAFGSATVATAGNSSPAKVGFAIIQSGDTAKRVQAWAQVGADTISPAALSAPPFAIPFDATTTAATTLYLFNPAASAALTLNLSVYDNTGLLIGSGAIVVPAQQEGAIPMTKTAAVFGNKKGILYVTGTGPVLAMGVRTGSDGRMSSVAPELLTAQ